MKEVKTNYFYIGEEKNICQSSCLSCRRTHKKCDRKLPSCALCTQKKKECVYSTTGRKSSKLDKSIQTPVKPSYGDIADCIPLNNNYPSQSEATFYKLYFEMPIINNKDVNLLLLHIERADSVQIGEGQPLEDSLDLDQLALVYAAKAMVVRGDNFPLSINYFEKSRQLIAPDFDNVIESYPMAACCIYLGMFCILDNQVDRAMFYANNAKTFLNFNVNSPSRDKRFNFINSGYYNLLELIEPSTTPDQMLKSFLIRLYVLEDFYGNKTHINGLSFKDEGEGTSTNIDRIIHEIKSDANIQLPLNINGILDMFKRLSKMHEKMKGLLPESIRNVRKVFVTSMMYGALLQYYERENQTEIARIQADHIIDSYCIQKRVLKASPMSYLLIKVASNAHLNSFEHCVDANQREIMYQYLIKDCELMGDITENTRMNEERLGALRARIQQAIWSYTNDQNILQNDET
ncbi:hypothetical protein AKO1_005639 [Acrasis kona]|uniref:Zn(2)-C6 fungal-type domain-containing protein n=1 Tax=Acrasis kona TaxID=1008807 RepID=A0AAW2YJS2_9EUKA